LKSSKRWVFFNVQHIKFIRKMKEMADEGPRL